MGSHVLCRVSRDLILWRKPTQKDGVSSCSFALHASPTAQIAITTGALDGSDKNFTLIPCEDPETNSAVEDAFMRFPHLRGCTALRFEAPVGDAAVAELVQQQLCVSTADDGNISSVTGVQMAGLLDTECATPVANCPSCRLAFILQRCAPRTVHTAGSVPVDRRPIGSAIYLVWNIDIAAIW